MARNAKTAVRIGALVAAVGLSASVATADPVIGNLAAPTGGSTIFGMGSTTQYKAFGFTMGATSYFLDDVRLTMIFDPDASPVVSIWSGASVPEMELIVLDNPVLGGMQDDYVFTPPSQFTMEGGQNYWVHVRSDPLLAPSFLWIATNPSTVPAGPGATAIGYIFNGNPSTFRNRLQVNGTVVPAPGALVALAGLGLAATPRRRR